MVNEESLHVHCSGHYHSKGYVYMSFIKLNWIIEKYFKSFFVYRRGGQEEPYHAFTAHRHQEAEGGQDSGQYRVCGEWSVEVMETSPWQSTVYGNYQGESSDNLIIAIVCLLSW